MCFSDKDFIEIPKIEKRIKGGFKMIYNEYDRVQEKVIKSQKDMCIFLALVKSFTYKNTEVKFNIKSIMNNCNVTEAKVYTMIKRLIKANMLLKVNRGYYRLNPFIYLPYRANGAELQKEWIELTKDI